MLLENAVNNAALGAFLAGLIKIYYDTQTVEACDQFVNTSLSESGGYSYYSPAIFPFPRWYAWSAGDFGLISLGGTENGQSGVRWFNGYFPQLSTTGFPSVNVVADNFYENFRRIPQLNAALIKKNLIVSGHSQGGCIGLALLRVRQRTPEGGSTKCITFGAPKAGKNAFLGEVNWVEKIRWMVDTDPIPQVPFNPTVQITPQIAFTPAEMFALQDFHQSEGGIAILASGDTQPAVLPPFAESSPSLDVGTWLYSLMFGVDSPHKIENYLARLQLNVRNTPVNPSGGTDWGQPEETPRVRTIEIARTQAPAHAAVSIQGAYQNSVAYATPDTVIFKKVKRNGQWFCAFGDVLITCGPTRRKAGRLAQAGNLFLQRLQREGVVDPAAIVSQFQSWLTAAQDPASGIAPTIVTTV